MNIALSKKRPPALKQRLVWQSGFAILELTIAISIIALLAVYASAQLANKSEESLAEGSAQYISQVASAVEQHTLLNFNQYSNGTTVPGVVTALAPTLAELRTLGRLNPGFPIAADSLPTRQSVRVDITRTGCPGATCNLTSLVCTTTPVNLGGSNPRFDLASTMVQGLGGKGGQALDGNGAVIRGPVLNVANPVGNVPGTVCGSASVDTALFQRFLVLNDPRDPNFQGALTVAGPTVIKSNASVTGTLAVTGDSSVGTCATILAMTGRAGFGCSNPNDLPAGWTGGVRSPDVVSNRVLASDNPAAFTGANGNYAYAGVSGGVAEIRTSGRAAADRLTPSGQYTVGTACAAADEGSISRRLGSTGLVVCQSSVWRALATGAAAGDPCTPEGSSATSATGVSLLCVGGAYRGMDTIIRSGTPGSACTASGVSAIDTSNSNEQLICRTNPSGGVARYMRMRDVTQNLSFVAAYEQYDGAVLTKPACSPASSQTAVPVLQLIPKSVSTTDGGISIYAIDNGTSWTIQLKNGSGAPLTGSPGASAIAQVFCYFP